MPVHPIHQYEGVRNMLQYLEYLKAKPSWCSGFEWNCGVSLLITNDEKNGTDSDSMILIDLSTKSDERPESESLYG
jgi:hypothetical protein